MQLPQQLADIRSTWVDGASYYAYIRIPHRPSAMYTQAADNAIDLIIVNIIKYNE